MNEEYINLPLVKNAVDKRFELKVGNYTAFIDYKEHGQKIWLIHTESPAELQGKCAATAVIEKTLSYIEANNYKLVPLCPLVAAYLKRHPELERLLDESARPL